MRVVFINSSCPCQTQDEGHRSKPQTIKEFQSTAACQLTKREEDPTARINRPERRLACASGHAEQIGTSHAWPGTPGWRWRPGR